MPPHAFTTLSPALQQQQLQATATWPVTNAVWDTARGLLLLSARHAEGKMDVKSIPMEGAPAHLLSSVALWWAVLTRSLVQMDLDALHTRAPQFAWITFEDGISELVAWTATASAAAKTEWLQAARHHISGYGDAPLADLSFDDAFDLIAGLTSCKPQTFRVPLLHWLTHWAATRRAGTLACRDMPPGESTPKVPANAPLSHSQWQATVKKAFDDGHLKSPQARTRLLAYSNAPPGGSPQRPERPPNDPAATPPWKRLLRGVSAVQDDTLLGRVDSLRALPDTAAPALALALATLVEPFNFAGNIKQKINSVTTAAALAIMVRAAWSACSAEARPRLKVAISEYLDETTAMHAPAVDHTMAAKTLGLIAPKLQRAEQSGFNAWVDAASKILLADALPATIVPHMSMTTNATTFRQAVHDSVLILTSSAQHEAIVKEIEAALTTPAVAPTQWFMDRQAAPAAGVAYGLQPTATPAVFPTGRPQVDPTGFLPLPTQGGQRVAKVTNLAGVDPVTISTMLFVALPTRFTSTTLTFAAATGMSRSVRRPWRACFLATQSSGSSHKATGASTCTLDARAATAPWETFTTLTQPAA